MCRRGVLVHCLSRLSTAPTVLAVERNLKAAEAQFRQARAVLRYYRADYYPTVTAGPSATRTAVETSPLHSQSFCCLPMRRGTRCAGGCHLGQKQVNSRGRRYAQWAKGRQDQLNKLVIGTVALQRGLGLARRRGGGIIPGMIRLPVLRDELAFLGKALAGFGRQAGFGASSN
jgi:hypothetical protein